MKATRNHTRAKPPIPAIGGNVLEAEAGAKSFHLPPVLDVAAAEPLRQSLRGLIDERQAFLVDGTDVERFSTLCAQVLIAAARSAEASGVSMRFENLSPDLLAAWDDLGIRGVLKKWMN